MATEAKAVDLAVVVDPVAEAVLVVEATAAGKPQGPYCLQKR